MKNVTVGNICYVANDYSYSTDVRKDGSQVPNMKPLCIKFEVAYCHCLCLLEDI